VLGEKPVMFITLILVFTLPAYGYLFKRFKKRARQRRGVRPEFQQAYELTEANGGSPARAVL
jgi:hypothetical protein